MLLLDFVGNKSLVVLMYTGRMGGARLRFVKKKTCLNGLSPSGPSQPVYNFC